MKTGVSASIGRWLWRGQGGSLIQIVALQRPPRRISTLSDNLEFQDCPHADDGRIRDWRGAARIERIGYVTARVNDVLEIRLQRPGRCQLHLIGQLDRRLVVADRHRHAGDCHEVAIMRRCLRRNAAVCHAEADDVVRLGIDATFEGKPGVEIKVDQVAGLSKCATCLASAYEPESLLGPVPTRLNFSNNSLDQIQVSETCYSV